MQDCHILKILSEGRKDISFHTPGHKMDAEYAQTIPMAAMDVTELSYTDDLSSPTGAIALAQCDIAKIAGAERSYILTDGSTSGVLAMVYAIARQGGKLIVARNCHKSVWNACAILGIEPVIVTGREENGVMLPPSPEQIDRVLCANQDVCGLIVTSPDYYGNIAPLKEYRGILKAKGKRLLVDGAHGGHLAFEEGRAGYAGVYSDAWVDGVHKSMPALTQGAILHLNDSTLEEKIEEGLNIFRTTSPSFPIMASVEYSVKYCDENRAKIEKVKAKRKEICEKLKRCGYGVYPSADWTKLAVDVSLLNLDSALACESLEKSGIYAEFNDGRYILFYLSVMTTDSRLDDLLKELENMKGQDDLKTDSSVCARYGCIENDGGADCLTAINAPFEYVPLCEATGRVCAANAGISPPCIPLAAAGEVITAEIVDALKKARHAFGLKDGKIKVVK